MGKMLLGKNIIQYRRKLGMTQEQMAEYLGVSKSAVSKWETAMTYPDIQLLPQLAALFNVTVDELMGYEAQISKKAGSNIYSELAKKIAKGNAEAVFGECEVYIKRYYSCFSFLQQMAVFYMNHCELTGRKEEMLDQAIALFRRIREESRDHTQIKDAALLEATASLMANRPEDILDILGEEVCPEFSESELIASAFQMLGNMEKAKELMQISFYQSLLRTMGSACVYLSMNMDNLFVAEETIRRIEDVFYAFHLEKLHENTALQFYAISAQVYAVHKQKDKALDKLEEYVLVCQNADFTLHGDDYFNQVTSWLTKLPLGIRPPRDRKLIKESLIAMVSRNPAFDVLKEEARFKEIIKCLEKL